jgi:hypothetical protein
MDKVKSARNVINQIREMPLDELQQLILKEMGEELSSFFLCYAKHLYEKDPINYSNNSTALAMIGYLCRKEEERLEKKEIKPITTGPKTLMN